MKRYLPIIAVVVLLLVGVGVYIQKDKLTKKGTQAVPSKELEERIARFKKNNPAEIPQVTPSPPLLPKNLTPEEVAFRRLGAVNATAAQRERQKEEGARLAVDGSLVTITQCQGDPFILGVKTGQTVTFENKDAEKHSILVDKEPETGGAVKKYDTYTVEANASTEVKISAKSGSLVMYFVPCGSEGLDGYFYVR